MEDERTDDTDVSPTGRLDASIAVSVVVKMPKLPTEVALALVAIEVQIRLVSLLVFL